MAQRGRKPVEQDALGSGALPEPAVPIERWSVENPFDPGEMMPREIVYVGNGDDSAADGEAEGVRDGG